jgi:hypothetical protein
MTDTTNLTYRGPAVAVSLLAQILREEGVQVDYDSPEERRDLGAVAATVVVSLACNGAYDLIKTAVLRFRATRFGPGSSVELPEPGRHRAP